MALLVIDNLTGLLFKDANVKSWRDRLNPMTAMLQRPVTHR